MEDGLFQIVFIVLALIGWVIKSAVEERERRKKQQQQRPSVPPRPRAESRDAPHRPAPHESGRPYPTYPTQATQPTRPVPPARSGGSREPGYGTEPTQGTDMAPSGPRRGLEVHPQLEVQKIERLRSRRLLPGQDKTLVAGTARERRRLLVHLGAGPVERSPRQLARSGVLWSAVLGPARALMGPHRPPHEERRRRG
jgi:hypothetical protein